jgi:hypothetical protein
MATSEKDTVLSIVRSGHHVIVDERGENAKAHDERNGKNEDEIVKVRILRDESKTCPLVLRYERDGEVVNEKTATPSGIPNVKHYEWTVDKQY